MRREYIYVLFAVFTWSTMGIFVRHASISGLIVTFFATLISSVIFGLLLVRERAFLSFFRKPYFWIPLSIGIFGILNNVTYFYAYQLTSIANATFAHYLAPVLVLMLSPILLAEKTNKQMWYAGIISLIGLFILLDPRKFSLSLGILLALISAFGYALGIIFYKKASKHYTNKEILFAQTFIATILLLPFALIINPTMNTTDLWLLAILGIIHQGIAPLIFIAAIRKLPPQNVSILTYLDPVGAVILAALILHEIPGWHTLIGGILILFSSYITIWNK